MYWIRITQKYFSNTLETAILTTADEVLPPPPKHQKNKWITNSTVTAIEKKSDIRKKFGDNSIEYKVAKAETKKLVRLY